MRIVDFHAHAFPDTLAARAVPMLEKEAGMRAALDGRADSLLRSMDAAGIERSVVLSIATKPDQFPAILKWSQSIASDRLIPFASVHPGDPEAPARIRAVHEAGLRGLKLHPYYQDFDVDEPRVEPIYDAAQSCGLTVVCHAGFDIAFPRIRRADPARVARVLDRFPRLVFVAAHLGAWEDWEEAERRLAGRPVYLETSYALEYLAEPAARRLLAAHAPDRLLFGSDSPWADQALSLQQLKALDLDPALLRAMLETNPARLLGVH